MFEYYGDIHVHVYCSGVGAYKPLFFFFFFFFFLFFVLPISCKTFTLNDI